MEVMDVIYDILAGVGIVVLFLATVAFTWGMILSRAGAKSQANATRELIDKLNPEVKAKQLATMKKEIEDQIKELKKK